MKPAGGESALQFEPAGLLAKAAATQRSWSEDAMPFGSHEGKCCCPGCAGESVLDDGLGSSSGDLAGLVLGLKMQALPQPASKTNSNLVAAINANGLANLAGAKILGSTNSISLREWNPSSAKAKVQASESLAGLQSKLEANP
ncbi:MAG: hypothetical protein ACKO81_00325, partial [Planctomycetota bacterium]